MIDSVLLLISRSECLVIGVDFTKRLHILKQYRTSVLPECHNSQRSPRTSASHNAVIAYSKYQTLNPT